MHFMTPETNGSCHYWWEVSFDHGVQDDQYFEELPPSFEFRFVEDIRACKHMQTMLDNDNSRFNDVYFSGDKHGLLFRRIVEKWVAE
jgi:Vanillate O-demethylase oxygenase C-terminal domain